MTLPNFIYAGAPKAGSSTIVEWLDQHPEIYFGAKKEPLFYGWSVDRGLDYYGSLYQGWSGEPVVADASVWYLGHERVPEQILETLGPVKVLFVLRDPVRRAWSHYWHQMQCAYLAPSVSFARALRDDAQWIRHFSLYGKHLRRWYDCFGKDAIRVIDFDAIHNPERLLSEIFSFLGVARDAPIDTSVGAMIGRGPRFQSLYRWLQDKHGTYPSKVISSSLVAFSQLNWRCSYFLFPENRKLRPRLTVDQDHEARRWFDEDILQCEELTELDLAAWKMPL